MRVLEVGEGLAAAYAARHLGNQGADVVKVEALGGDPARCLGPFANDVDEERSGLFLAVNLDKRGVCLDLGTEAGQAQLARLLAWANVLVHSLRSDEARRLGLDAETLRTSRPDLVVLAMTPVRPHRALCGPCRRGAHAVPWRRLGGALSHGASRAELSAIEDARPPLQPDGGRGRGDGDAGRASGSGAIRGRRDHRLFGGGIRRFGAGIRHPCLHLPRLRHEAHGAAVADSVAHIRHAGRRHLPGLHRAGPMGAAGCIHGQPGVGDTGRVRDASGAKREPGPDPRLPRRVHCRLGHLRPLPRRPSAPHLHGARDVIRGSCGGQASCCAGVLHQGTGR